MTNPLHRTFVKALLFLKPPVHLTTPTAPQLSTLLPLPTVKNLPHKFLARSFSVGPIRAFSASPPTEWKSIGKKTRKMRHKLKTHQGASKRFFVTGHGQFKRCQAGTQHLMTGLTHSHKRRLKPMVIVAKSHATLLRKLLPYAGKRGGFRRMNEEETVWWKHGRLQKAGTALGVAVERARRAVSEAV